MEGNFRFAAQWRNRNAVVEDPAAQTTKQSGTSEPAKPSSKQFERTVVNIDKTFSTGKQTSTPLDKLPYPKRFIQFHTATIDMEGNVQLEHDKSDLGGKTAWGISSAANPDLSQEIASGMTRDRGFQIAYERYYSVIPNIDTMEPRIAFVVYDSRFHGMKENLVVIESSLKKMGYNVVDDGKFEQETYRVLTSLSSQEADLIMGDLNRALKLSAASAAKRVMVAQEKRGLDVKDYTAGFVNRQMRRLAYAQNFRSISANT